MSNADGGLDAPIILSANESNTSANESNSAASSLNESRSTLTDTSINNNNNDNRTRGYCYTCRRNVDINLTEYTCMQCAGGFVEVSNR
jgi:hypothetical protein